MDELTDGGASTLLEGGPPSALADALLDLWTDVEHRDDVQPRMLACGLMRSVEVWDTLTLDGRSATNVADALDRMFGTFALRPEVLDGLPEAHREAFVEALLERIDALVTTTAPLEDEALGWVAPACSVVAVAPSVVGRALSPVFAPDASRWAAALRYFAVLGYPAADHPWRSEPLPLWDRFGSDDGARWTPQAVDALREQLEDAPARARFDAIAALAEGTADEVRAREVCEELVELQMPAVWSARRECLLGRLGDASPSPYWDDEMGITAR